jgi:glycosyltransferase involved in cell wall biosynthesis
MKVLYMCEWAGHGIHPQWLHYAYGLQKAGACVYLAASGTEYDPGTLQEARDCHLNMVELPEFFDRWNGFRNAGRALARWLSANSVDVIHCQGFRELHDVARACRMNRQEHRIVMTDRNAGGWAGIDAVKRIALILRERPVIIALSQAHYERLRRIPRMAKRAAFIPNGVNTEVFSYVSRASRPGDGLTRLIYPARLEGYKGHSEFLGLCKELARSGRRFELLLAGGGSLEESVRNEVKSLELTDYVKPLGRLPWKALPGLFAICDVGVFPSPTEMMPKAVLEMMSTGLPVVAYDTGGIRHIIDHGKTGYITAVGDKKSFRSYLERLMDNADLCRTIGDAARRQMQDHFSIEVISKRTLALYNCLCGERHRS